MSIRDRLRDNAAEVGAKTLVTKVSKNQLFETFLKHFRITIVTGDIIIDVCHPLLYPSRVDHPFLSLILSSPLQYQLPS